MTTIHRVVAALVLVFACTSLRAQTPDTIAFNNWVKQSVPHGETMKSERVGLVLTSDSLVVHALHVPMQSPPEVREATVTIPYAAITRLTYDRRARMRKMAPTYGKRQQHFLTVQYKTGTVGEFVEFEFSKDIAANVMATLEARSGQKIENVGG